MLDSTHVRVEPLVTAVDRADRVSAKTKATRDHIASAKLVINLRAATQREDWGQAEVMLNNSIAGSPPT